MSKLRCHVSVPLGRVRHRREPEEQNPLGERLHTGWFAGRPARSPRSRGGKANLHPDGTPRHATCSEAGGRCITLNISPVQACYR